MAGGQLRGLPGRSRAGTPWPTAGSAAPASASAARSCCGSRRSRPTSSSPPSARSWACSATTAVIVAFILLFGSGLQGGGSHHGPLRQAPRHRSDDPPGGAGVHHHGGGHPAAARSPASRCRSSATAVRPCSATTSCWPCWCASATTTPAAAVSWPIATGPPRGRRRRGAVDEARREPPDRQARRRPAGLLPGPVHDGQLRAGHPRRRPQRGVFRCYESRADDRSQPPTAAARTAASSCATSTAPAARSSPPTASCSPRAVPAPEGDRFELQRVYPTGELFAHTTGFLNFSFGADGAERAFNDDLAGQTTELEFQSISDLFVDRDRVGDVTLTLRADVQEAARAALGSSEVRSSPSTPAPAPCSPCGRSRPTTRTRWPPTTRPRPTPAAPRSTRPASNHHCIPAAYRKSFFPGSTFKVVTGSIGVEGFGVTDTQPGFPARPSSTSTSPTTSCRTSRGVAASSCGGTLPQILADSCNSAFAYDGRRH